MTISTQNQNVQIENNTEQKCNQMLTQFSQIVARFMKQLRAWKEDMAEMPGVPNAFTSLSEITAGIQRRKEPRLARNKKVIELNMKLLDAIDGWRGFVKTDPGYLFDGVDISEGEDGPEIVAGYGIDKDGNRKTYTVETRATIEAMVAVQASNVTAIKAG